MKIFKKEKPWYFLGYYHLFEFEYFSIPLLLSGWKRYNDCFGDTYMRKKARRIKE